MYIEKQAFNKPFCEPVSRKNVIFLSHSLVIDNKRGAGNEQNANRRSCGGIVLIASNAQAQTVPEGYQLQQVLMMSRHNLRAPLANNGSSWSSRRRINGQNGTSPVGNSPPKGGVLRSVYGPLHA